MMRPRGKRATAGIGGVVQVCMPERLACIVVECDVTIYPFGAEPDVKVLRWHDDTGNPQWDGWKPAETCPVTTDDADATLIELAEEAAFMACGDGGPRGLAEDYAAGAADDVRAERKDEGRGR